MSFYKIAQAIRFANETNVKNKIMKMRDAEYTAYISVLSQIHENVSQGQELDVAIEEVAGSSFLRPVKAFIEDLGMQNFLNFDFGTIAKALDEIKKSFFEKDVVKEQAPVQIEKETAPLTIDELMQLDSGTRLEYFENLEYPENRLDEAEHILENFKLIESAYSDEDTPEASRNWYQKELVSAMLTLLDIAFKEQEDEEEIEETETTEVKPKKPAKNKGLRSVHRSKGSRGVRYVSFSSVGSTLEKDTIFEEEILSKPSFKEFQSRSNNPYVDFNQNPPEINQDLDTAFGEFLSKIDKMRNEALSNGSGTALRKQFNDLIFAVKTADTMAYDELKQRSKTVSEEFEKSYKDLEHRLLTEAPTQVIMKEEYFDSLFYASLLISESGLGDIFLATDNLQLQSIIQKDFMIQKSGFEISDSDIDFLRSTMESLAKNAFKNKTRDFFRLTSKYHEKNFLEHVALQQYFIFKLAFKKLFPNNSRSIYKPCPTCYKYVPWTNIGKSKDTTGFKVRLVSFFTNDRSRPKISEEDLESGSWPPLPSSLYSREREQQLAVQYAKEGERSWKQIQALLSSNNPILHEEGWHRRSGALYAAGGVLLGTTDLFVKNMFNECPFDVDSKNSLCGVSFSPPTSIGSSSKRLALQPQWNGIKDSTIAKADNKGSLNEELWQDEEMLQQAKNLQKGGFKFSKINFACTCRIKEVDNLSSYKHGHIAISKTGTAGSADFIYPTQPNGALDTDLEDGTLTYMVCGAPTSLSSFDRSPESNGYILRYLQKVRETSIGDYQELISYLLRSGIDIQDIMDLDHDLEAYIRRGLEKESSSMQIRMQKLAQLLKEATIQMNPDGNLKYLGDMTLVCPFGHKFTVEHSLSFGQANAGIFQSDKIVKNYAKLITTKGEGNLKALVADKYLVPADSPEMSIYTNKLPYKEWIQTPDGVVFPDHKEPEKPLLLFSIPVNLQGDLVNYVFYKKLKGWKNNVWSADRSYDTSRQEDVYESNTIRSLSLDVEIGEGTLNLEDQAAFDDWKINETNPVSGFEFNQIPTSSLPGTPPLEDDTGYNLQAFDKRIAAFSRALKSTLRIIQTWTKGLVSSSMMDALLTDYQVNVHGYVNEIIAPILPLLHFEDIDGEAIPKNSLGPIIEDVKSFFVERINQKTNALHDWIRSNIDQFSDDESFDNKIAYTIILNVIKEFNSPNPDIGFNSEHGEAFITMDNFETHAQNAAKKIVDSTSQLAQEITLKTQGYKEHLRKKVQYSGRVYLIGYAQYLANALSLIYKKYCQDPTSYFYIGYQIGVDLSSSDKILGSLKDGAWVGGISEQEVDKIVSSYGDAVKTSGAFKKPQPQTLHYGYRLDRAWSELEGYLTRARKQSVSARAMELSKEYIVNRMSLLSGTEPKNIVDKITNTFPARSLLFNGTTENPETGPRQISKRRLPFISKSVNFLEIPGTQKVEEWIVRNKRKPGNKTFGSKAEAEKYIAHILVEDKNSVPTDWLLEPDPYWVNQENGYNGSKMQVGMITPKVIQDFKWPPDPGAMDFVGINLPFEVPNVQADASINKAKDLAMPNHRFMINFDGEPLDISILFRRGKEDEDLEHIAKAEKVIIAACNEKKRNIELFKQQHAAETSLRPKLIADYTAQEEARFLEEIEPYLRIIDSKNLYVTTKSSYIDPSDLNTPRKMLRIAIEDPIRAYRIIMNPQIRGIELSREQQTALLDFIIRVYNLDIVRDFAREQGGIYANLETKDLFEKASELKFNFLAAKMKKPTIKDANGKDKLGWVNDAGEYFDLEPGEADSDYGSYLQYTYLSSSQNATNSKQHPNILTLISSVVTAKSQNAAANEDTLSFPEKMEKDMLSYIKARTSGERKNPAKDHKRKKKASEFLEKIALRQDMLERMQNIAIFSMGLVYFDDVEFPGF